MYKYRVIPSVSRNRSLIKIRNRIGKIVLTYSTPISTSLNSSISLSKAN